MKKIVVDTKCEVEQELAKIILDVVAHNNGAVVGLSGGSLVSLLGSALKPHEKELCQSGLRFIFCDERLVPSTDAESTFGAYAKAFPQLLVDKMIPVDVSLEGNAAAAAYEQKLRECGVGQPNSGFPQFDLLLLGLGPDGHTCSLFPDHPLLKESSEVVAFIGDSPKPPPQRVTLTLPAVCAARRKIFPITGEGKASMVKKIFDLKTPSALIPASLVTDAEWLMDRGAASLL